MGPQYPEQFEWDGEKYVKDVEGVGAFRISTTCGPEWYDFYDGSLITVGTPSSNNQTIALTSGNSNIVCPWTGDWHFEVSADLSRLYLSTTTPRPTGFTPVYLRGTMNDWGNDEGFFDTNGDGTVDDLDTNQWRFKTTDGKIYTLDPVVLGNDDEFKVADQSWSKVNYGGGPVYFDRINYLTFNSSNCYIEWGDLDVSTPLYFTFNLDNESLEVIPELNTGVETMATDTSTAVYYNMQGVRVVYPTDGMYIKVQGNKACKVVVK